MTVDERQSGGDDRHARTAAHRSRRGHPRLVHSFVPDRSRRGDPLLLRPTDRHCGCRFGPRGYGSGSRWPDSIENAVAPVGLPVLARPRTTAAIRSSVAEILWTLWIPSAPGSCSDDRLGLPSVGLDPVRELGHLVIDRASLRHQGPDLPIGVHHRRVVAAAELLADLW